MSVTHTRTQAHPESTTAPGTERRLLQRQIMPKDRDTDVIRLYVDPDPGVLDADKYEVGHNRQAQELNAVAMRQAVGTGSQVHP
ncbi:MAG: glycosyltransferase, partial [Nocardioides sp.]